MKMINHMDNNKWRCQIQRALLAFIFVALSYPSSASQIDIGQVRSFEYIIANSWSMDATLAAIRNSPVDLVILNHQSGAKISRVANDPLNSKLIIGYIDIGESTGAVTGTYFGGVRPSWFGLPTPGFTDLYSIQYWNPTWKDVIYAQIDEQIAAGYDGIFLDVINGYINWLPGNVRGNPAFPGATVEMGNLVADIRSYILSKHLPNPFYLISSPFPELEQAAPGTLSMFDAVFNEVLTYEFNLTDATKSVPTLGNNAQWIEELKSFYKGKVVLGGDYPPLTDVTAVSKSFSMYANYGWISSVNAPFQTADVLNTGPFLLTATDRNLTVRGSTNRQNFISGGMTSSPTLIGGDVGDTFIGGPGKNTIVGGAGNDTIYPHPRSALAQNQLTVKLSSGITGDWPAPTVSIYINGTLAIQPTAITARYQVANQVFTINTSGFTPINSVSLNVTGTNYVNSTNYSNVQIEVVTYRGTSIDLSKGSYSNGGGGSGWGYSNSGTVTFAASAFQGAPAYPADNSSTIDGGGGRNTAIYWGPFSEYKTTLQLDGSVVVTSLVTPEGPDTLRNVQQLQFVDDCLFAWAERTYPQFFAPAAAASAVLSTYYYRYYPDTGNYLATSSADSHLYAVGSVTGGNLLDLGPLTNFLSVAGCSN